MNYYSTFSARDLSSYNWSTNSELLLNNSLLELTYFLIIVDNNVDPDKMVGLDPVFSKQNKSRLSRTMANHCSAD